MKLYHYADQNAFMSIIKNKELWATKIQYLNDENEYKLALSIAEKYLTNLQNTVLAPGVLDLISRLLEELDNISNVNICVCSLSEQGDLLSQWRGYSTSLGGYSIGFDFKELQSLATKHDFRLEKCVYSPSEQESLVHDVINRILSEFNAAKGSFSPVRTFKNDMCLLSPIIKDKSFEEEGEWRLFSQKTFSELDFRAGKSMLTPFAKFPLDSDLTQLLSEIIIGHTPHVELAVKSTQAFLIKHYPPKSGYDYSCKFEVRPSSIPFRNW